MKTTEDLRANSHSGGEEVRINLKTLALLSAVLVSAPSCGGDDDGGNGGNGDGDSSVGDGDAGDGDGSGDGDSNNGDGDSGDGDGSGDGDSGDGDGMNIADEFEACAVEAREAESLPADIFFMIDQSISMVDHTVPDNDDSAPTRWKVLRDAVLEFVDDDASAGLRVGLQFFPQFAGNEVSCEVEDYATAKVGIDSLPGNASALADAYPESPLGGLTSSHPALEGALTFARDWGGKPENVGRGVAVVWVTDGFPTVCDDTTISGLAAVADSFNKPEDGEIRVPTFVVGLGPVANLSTVARAGGTGDGYFVADADGAVDSLLASLRRVANSPALCEFNFPEAADGSPLDPNKVNMQFTPEGASAPEAVPQTTGPSACDNGGWYYDNPADPEKIYVCPSTCGNFGGGMVSIVAGCKSVTIF